ncbi:MAG TPA: alkaline phosphatase family protein [Candidatus Dormibacteraeota bacterium]|nr:alkaline phosphatase family protein [Candidatus Dormibacteraeota bacterium]
MLLILGLDGATLDLVEPWIAEGRLPHLARLRRDGAWGRLASTVPAATFPSWTTFMTGVNPGRHGVLDFTRRERGEYRVRFVNATYRKAPTIWRLLSDAGRRVSVLGLPGTYPPEAINGYMVSGFDTPVTTRADASFVHPPEFAAEMAQAGGFPFADFQEFNIGPGWHAEACRRLCDGIAHKVGLASRLLAREPWDCLMLLFGESDTAAHHFWALHDARSPRHAAAQAAALGDPLRTVYVALDDAVGRLMAMVPEATVLVVSDHGFGGAGTTGVRLNRWLAQQGMLRFAPRAGAARWAGRLRAAAVRVIPESWQARCFRLGDGALASRVESGVRFGGIEWSATRAFSEELNYFPSIWLNVQGRDRCGTVPVGDYSALCEELRAALLAWRDPHTGDPVVARVWHRDELYTGAWVATAPDLVLELANPGGYSYVGVPSYGADGPAVEALDPAALGGKLAGMSGSHRSDGLFMLSGAPVQPGCVDGAQIADMAPTIMALCGVAAPDDWDGRALAALRRAPLSPVTPSAWSAVEADYDEAATADLRRRLELLGYLA